MEIFRYERLVGSTWSVKPASTVIESKDLVTLQSWKSLLVMSRQVLCFCHVQNTVYLWAIGVETLAAKVAPCSSFVV